MQVTLARDAVASVPLQYNTSTLAPGTYQSIVQISSNDPLMPVVNLTVHSPCLRVHRNALHCLA